MKSNLEESKKMSAEFVQEDLIVLIEEDLSDGIVTFINCDA